MNLSIYKSTNVWIYQSNYQSINLAMYHIDALSVYHSIILLGNEGPRLISDSDESIYPSRNLLIYQALEATNLPIY